MNKTHICVICGREYLKTGSRQKCCTLECRKELNRRDQRRWRKRNKKARKATPSGSAKHPVHGVGVLALETITHATKRPEGCSAVRWRIELRRRANPQRYADYGIDVEGGTR